MKSSFSLLVALHALAVALWSSPAAARPSLIDLDSDLQQVVSGLCNGDPALCGVVPSPAVAGQLDFDGGLFGMDFTEVTFAFTKPLGGNLSYAALVATIDATGLEAGLTDELLTNTLYSQVEVIVPDPSGPGNVVLLELGGARFGSFAFDGTGSSANFTLTFSSAQMTWLGNSSDWNSGTGTGSGCIAPGSEQHVALAGNAASLLAAGEVEAAYALGLNSFGNVTFEYTRAIDASSPCYLRTAGSGLNRTDSFHRLSPLSDTFASQLREQSIDFTSSTIGDYTLSITAGDLAETVSYLGIAGTLTTRTFDPATGAQTGGSSQGF